MENSRSNIRTILLILALIWLSYFIYQAEPQDKNIFAEEAKDYVTLPIEWGNLGKELIDSGVIDEEAFRKLYEKRDGVPEDVDALFSASYRDKVRVTKENAPYLLNIFWAFGFGNKNPILEEGPIAISKTPVSNFASTGGWSLATGDNMGHFSKHQFVTLTKKDQALVEEVAKNIYRPCCGNSTYFPDCNHGMAMLGLLELMAANGTSEEKMYEIALAVNTLWFPDSYELINRYIEEKNIPATPKEILSADFSSGKGIKKIKDALKDQKTGGASCGV